MKNKLPDEWKIVKLIDISEDISAGGTPLREKKEYWQNGTIPWLKIADMKSVYITKTEEKITNKGLENSSAKLFPKGTLVYSIFASLGAIGILDIDASTNQAIAGINPKKDIITTKYLYHCLQSEKNKILSKKSHATQDNLNLTILRNHEIPLPPLSTQKKIVSILEQAEALKQKREQADKLTEDYVKSVFYEMFYNKGFENIRLSEVCEINPKKSEIRELNENLEISFVPMEDLDEHQPYFKQHNTKKIKEVYTRYTYFRENDVLLAKVTPCFENGKSGIAKNLKNKIGFGSSEFHVLRPSNKILAPLIYYFISNDQFINAGKKQMSGTGGLKRLSKNYIENFKIPLPPAHLQKIFSSIVYHVEKLKEKQKKSKEQIDELFNSLMQKAFKGELAR